MKTIVHKQRGQFNWRCLFGHKWAVGRLLLRHYSAPSLDDFWWLQKTCTRCGAKHGTETPNVE